MSHRKRNPDPAGLRAGDRSTNLCMSCAVLSLHKHGGSITFTSCPDCGSDNMIRLPGCGFTRPRFKRRWLRDRLYEIQQAARESKYLGPDQPGYYRVVPPSIIVMSVYRHAITGEWVREKLDGPAWLRLTRDDQHDSKGDADNSRIAPTYSPNLRMVMPGRIVWRPGDSL